MTEPNKIFVRPLSFEGMSRIFIAKKMNLIHNARKNTN